MDEVRELTEIATPGRQSSRMTAESTFGGGVKAPAGRRIPMSVLRNTGLERKAVRNRACRRGADSLGHFFLKHYRDIGNRRAVSMKRCSSAVATL
jgi:hypothetical protein